MKIRLYFPIYSADPSICRSAENTKLKWKHNWKSCIFVIAFLDYILNSQIDFFFQDLKEVQTFIYEADFALYQYLIDILLPKVLKPIPNALTQGIRTFSKNLETWMVSALTSVPDTLKDLKVFHNQLIIIATLSR